MNFRTLWFVSSPKKAVSTKDSIATPSSEVAAESNRYTPTLVPIYSEATPFSSVIKQIEIGSNGKYQSDHLIFSQVKPFPNSP